ncbi:MAG: sugar phosphate isomerase/epimerase [Spirochaetes bacterium]|nr:MAG: sugar phosphate isomerase/epimerase [Spirochaetota bacterium]RKX95957.1 MAG: sugar phosphate isomerase/epimerase [Spirochaetota bacterium]
MYLTGFADEAADSIDGQIEVTKKLGWSRIEIRAVDGLNIHDLPDAEFSQVKDKLERAGIQANALGSNIANWGHDIGENFDEVLKTVDRTIQRMKALNTNLVRVMSWKVIRDNEGRAIVNQQAEERFRRLREITTRFTDAGITPVHENCATYGGMNPKNTLEMLQEVPGLKLVFDTGNPPLTEDFDKPWPYPDQSSWDFYSAVKEHIAHIHIKDSYRNTETREEVYCWPGEGRGDVKRILEDLKSRGYSGGLSIEPHMAVVYHDNSVKASRESRMANYVEYGQRLETLLGELGVTAES